MIVKRTWGSGQRYRICHTLHKLKQDIPVIPQLVCLLSRYCRLDSNFTQIGQQRNLHLFVSCAWFVIYPDLFDWIFFREALDPFFSAQGVGFSEFILQNCNLILDAEQVYLKLQVTNLKNKEVTVVDPKPRTLKKNWVFENPKP